MGRAPNTKSVATRLRENSTVSPDGCWLWTASTVNGGYGQIWVGSRTDGTRRNMLAHVASYETFVGSVPAGLELDHRCFNTACINPEHLEPVTRQENVRRHWSRPSRADELPTLVSPDAQAMWEALGILGFDLDGDPTPAAVIGGMGPEGFRGYFLRSVREMRKDYEDALDEIPA